MMLYISSRDNALYKHVRRLVQGQSGRRSIKDNVTTDTGALHTSDNAIQDAVQDTVAIVLEGVHLCQDWLRHRGQPERAIFDAQRLQDSSELQALASRIRDRHIVSMDTALVQSISPVAKGQGVLFLVSHDLPALPLRIDHPCLWLDRIQDPGNVGTLLRTAAAAGIQHAYLSKGCASVWSSRVLRSAQGAHFVMTLHEQVDLLQVCQHLTVPLCTTSLRDGAVSLYESRIPTPCAWVFGNEGQGVDPALQAIADHCVYIPQDASVESLNVGVAAGICLFEQRRQQVVMS